MISNIPYDEYELNLLSCCKLCPRECKVNRLKGEKGFCQTDASINVALVCNHKGEEPTLSGEKGVCNVFFTHCNLQCLYCQNKQISNNKNEIKNTYTTFEDLILEIKKVLKESENIIGFVSPTHSIPLMRAIIRTLHSQGIFPKIIYNTNAYDKVEILRELEGFIDIYLPDYKYSDNQLAKELSMAQDYPQTALKAIEEMYHQKGKNGVIIRHLILPTKKENSKKALWNLSDISFSLNISLMSQYTPCEHYKQEYLNQYLNEKEYEEICDYFYEIGLSKGFFQSLSSQGNLVPDFTTNTWSQTSQNNETF